MRCLSEIAGIFKKADFSIANLELTFGGKPYSGFPKFSSPDSLAVAIKKANINVLVELLIIILQIEGVKVSKEPSLF